MIGFGPIRSDKNAGGQGPQTIDDIKNQIDKGNDRHRNPYILGSQD